MQLRIIRTNFAASVIFTALKVFFCKLKAIGTEVKAIGETTSSLFLVLKLVNLAHSVVSFNTMDWFSQNFELPN